MTLFFRKKTRNYNCVMHFFFVQQLYKAELKTSLTTICHFSVTQLAYHITDNRSTPDAPHCVSSSKNLIVTTSYICCVK